MNKYCQNCGTEINTDSKFCQNCGSGFGIIPDEKLYEIKIREAEKLIHDLEKTVTRGIGSGLVFFIASYKFREIISVIILYSGDTELKQKTFSDGGIAFESYLNSNAEYTYMIWILRLLSVCLISISIWSFYQYNKYRKMLLNGDLSFVK